MELKLKLSDWSNYNFQIIICDPHSLKYRLNVHCIIICIVVK